MKKRVMVILLPIFIGSLIVPTADGPDIPPALRSVTFWLGVPADPPGIESSTTIIVPRWIDGPGKPLTLTFRDRDGKIIGRAEILTTHGEKPNPFQ